MSFYSEAFFWRLHLFFWWLNTLLRLKQYDFLSSEVKRCPFLDNTWELFSFWSRFRRIFLKFALYAKKNEEAATKWNEVHATSLIVLFLPLRPFFKSYNSSPLSRAARSTIRPKPQYLGFRSFHPLKQCWTSSLNSTFRRSVGMELNKKKFLWRLARAGEWRTVQCTQGVTLHT